ncbi:hypothetical protein [Nocardioides baculatus]|uniref:Nuclear transport factor 2 family protein n=1 Tax=Nocardioides baculatus TaxID=2801337 RepID=A0ABS1L657_9ACTN|nr:hypothetical protein [Nocardioides baculatus]MBL0747169.1 hypothetical protein [Nocardioides baculatus]
MVAALALGAVACGERPPPRASETTAASPEPTDDLAAIAAAEATVRAFFAVKGRAEDPIRVQIDQQAAYLTSRDVHPTTAYDASTSDQPSGITDETVDVELSNARTAGEEVRVDFAFQSTGVTYTLIDGELQLDMRQPQESHWDGTATLEELDGEWLINDLSLERYGSSIG